MDLPYPYYRLQADGPNETGFGLLVHIEEGAGGPLPGMTTQGVLDSLRALLEGTGGTVTTTLALYAITTTDNPS
ncbi:hypothetical protein [Streptomyces sp. NPDC007856]|uniref:hypothetical protein n=1 Tax=Streptomyces sp. NPDC007856 TaxID=3364781 RepID=UPI0036A50111